jgi:hypothetical protein
MSVSEENPDVGNVSAGSATTCSRHGEAQAASTVAVEKTRTKVRIKDTVTVCVSRRGMDFPGWGEPFRQAGMVRNVIGDAR